MPTVAPFPSWWPRFYSGWFLFALFYGSVSATSIVMERARDGLSALPLWIPLFNELSGTLALLPLLPLVRWFDGVYRFTADRWLRALCAHLLFTLPFALAHVAIFVTVRKLVYAVLGSDYPTDDPLFGLIYEYRKSLLAYSVIVFSLYGFRHYIQLRELLEMPDARTETSVADAPSTAAAAEKSPAQRFIARRNDREVIVAAANIRFVESAGNYVVLHTDAGPLKLRETLAALEQQLDAKNFARIHRSHIVNLDAVKEIQPWFHGDYRVLLKDGTLLNLSRRYRERIKTGAQASPFIPS